MSKARVNRLIKMLLDWLEKNATNACAYIADKDLEIWSAVLAQAPSHLQKPLLGKGKRGEGAFVNEGYANHQGAPPCTHNSTCLKDSLHEDSSSSPHKQQQTTPIRLPHIYMFAYCGQLSLSLEQEIEGGVCLGTDLPFTLIASVLAQTLGSCEGFRTEEHIKKDREFFDKVVRGFSFTKRK